MPRIAELREIDGAIWARVGTLGQLSIGIALWTPDEQAKVRLSAANYEREECAIVAVHFTVKSDASIYPRVKFNEMNETARAVSHTTAQQIAAAIRERSGKRLKEEGR